MGWFRGHMGILFLDRILSGFDLGQNHGLIWYCEDLGMVGWVGYVWLSGMGPGAGGVGFW